MQYLKQEMLNVKKAKAGYLIREIKMVFSGKKGIAGSIVNEINGIVLAGIVIVLSVVVIVQCAPMFGKSPEGHASRTNLEALAAEIEILLESPKKFDTGSFILSVEEDYAIVGFDRDWDENLRSEGKEDFIWSECGYGNIMEKPIVDECKHRACLCLYERSALGQQKDFGIKNTPIECRGFDEDIIFLGRVEESADTQEMRTRYDSKEIALTYGLSISEISIPYTYFFRYGRYNNCKEPWEARMVYVEKFERDDGKAFVYITAETENTKARKAAIMKALNITQD